MNPAKKEKDEFIKFMETLEPMHDKINDTNYQVKLTNIMNLLQIDSNLKESYFDFMIEAQDYETLAILKEKYRSESLIKAYSKVDPDSVVTDVRVQVTVLNNYINNDQDFIL